MIDYEVRRSQKRCSKTDRIFDKGERYISGLFETESGFERLDFAEDQWGEKPDACIGWWHCRVPETSKDRVYWAPNDVLLAYFESLLEKPNHDKILFVMGIVLVRRKILKMAPNEKNDEGRVFMVLETIDKSNRYQVPMVEPTPDEITLIQNTLAEQLFSDQPPENQ